MLKRRESQSPQKEFGEVLTINKSESDDDPLDLQFDLRPELPSHVPTPRTINQGLTGIKTMFDADDDATTKRVKRNSNKRLSTKVLSTPVTPESSSDGTTRKLKILIASPSSSKWGPDVWKSKMRDPLSLPPLPPLPSNVTKRPPSPSSAPLHKSKSAKKLNTSSTKNTSTPTQNKTNVKVILSEESIETVDKSLHSTKGAKNKSFNSYLNNKGFMASPLQRRWMQENELNLYSSCQDLSATKDGVSGRRFRFMSRRESVACSRQ
jgi:hypothetical protein